jgi:hypothetical protein
MSRHRDRASGYEVGVLRQTAPRDAIGALVSSFSNGRRQGQERELDFSLRGGDYNRVLPDATAFAHRHQLFTLKTPSSRIRSRPPPRRMRLTVDQRILRIGASLGSGRVFPNLADPELPEWADAYHDPALTPEAADRLASVVRDLYHALVQQGPARSSAPLAVHLRAASVMRAGVPDRLASLLKDMRAALEQEARA